MTKAVLALEDGTLYHGQAFGSRTSACGEVCFNTSMTGYQEILTDPSYKAQIVAMTYPQIGNSGVNSFDVESYRSHVSGFVIRELSPIVSNWRADTSLENYLEENAIPGIQGIDTRALTKKLRVRGAMNGIISTDGTSDEEALEKAKSWHGLAGIDYAAEVSHKEPFDWDPNDELSKEFRVVDGPEEGNPREMRYPLPDADISIVAYDFGIKYNILRRLRQHGFKVRVVPATTTAEEVLSYKPAGLFLSNGPGDPSALGYAAQNIKSLVDHGLPVFGICLGHQVLSMACGAKTFKLKFGHRGANQPVKNHNSERVEITSQNHGYAVDPESLPSDMRVHCTNLNDQTVEGVEHKSKPVFSVQYHPEASPGPHDSTPLFADFRNLILSKSS